MSCDLPWKSHVMMTQFQRSTIQEASPDKRAAKVDFMTQCSFLGLKKNTTLRILEKRGIVRIVQLSWCKYSATNLTLLASDGIEVQFEPCELCCNKIYETRKEQKCVTETCSNWQHCRLIKTPLEQMRNLWWTTAQWKLAATQVYDGKTSNTYVNYYYHYY